MPVETAFLTAAWAAGIMEGASILSRAKEDEEERAAGSPQQLLVPAVLYGTISLPLGLIGASPGPTTIGYLPFVPPKIDALFLRQQEHSLLPPGMPPQLPLAATAARERPSTADNTCTTRTVAPDKLNIIAAAIESNAQPNSQKGKRRVDLLREENRNRQLRSSASTTAPSVVPPAAARVSSIPTLIPTRYLATLDGQALPTPLAEAMRRTRFLLVGAGLVTLALSYNNNSATNKKPTKVSAAAPGKDAAAIQRLVANNKQGAVLRYYCDSPPQAASTKISSIATIPLYSKTTTNGALLFWNPGGQPEEWKTTPISIDWLMRTSSKQNRLVLEADVTPITNNSSFMMEHYFEHCNNNKDGSSSHPASTARTTNTTTNNLSNAILLFHSLIETATTNSVLKSPMEAVQVILGCSNKPVLPLPNSNNVVYVDATIGLGVEVESVLESMHQQVQLDLLMAKTEYQGRKAAKRDTKQESAPADTTKTPAQTADPAMLTIMKQDDNYLATIVNNAIIPWIDSIGSSIRQTASWTVDHIKDLQEDYSFRRQQQQQRVVHVLSDQRHFVQFLQRSLHADWRIVWYDTAKESDVTLYQATTASYFSAPITVVCCSTDAITRAFLMATAMDSADESQQQPRILAIVVEQQSDQVASDGVTTIGIREVHDNLFSNVRDLLSEGKTVDEVQDIIGLIR